MEFEEFIKTLKEEEFKDWMQYEFNYSCHKKYRKYFEEAFNNLTDDQIHYFKQMMWRLKYGILGLTSRFFEREH